MNDEDADYITQTDLNGAEEHAAAFRKWAGEIERGERAVRELTIRWQLRRPKVSAP